MVPNAPCAPWRTSPSSNSAPPTSMATRSPPPKRGGQSHGSGKPGGHDGADAEHVRLPAGAEAHDRGAARSDQGHGGGAPWRGGLLRQGAVWGLPSGPLLPRRQDARSARGTLLYDPHYQW